MIRVHNWCSLLDALSPIGLSQLPLSHAKSDEQKHSLMYSTYIVRERKYKLCIVIQVHDHYRMKTSLHCPTRHSPIKMWSRRKGKENQGPPAFM